jgi:CHAT domain-containing protein/Tfp pilus assembly protein PilF
MRGAGARSPRFAARLAVLVAACVAVTDLASARGSGAAGDAQALRTRLAAADSLLRSQQIALADSLANALHREAEAAFGAHSTESAEALVLRGDVARVKRALPEARALFESALRTLESHSPNAPSTVRAISRLAWTYTALEMDRQAVDLLEPRLAAFAITPPEDPAALPPLLYTLAAAHRTLGDLARADSLFGCALALTPESDARGRSRLHNGLGMVRQEEARFAEAQDQFEQAVAAARASGTDPAGLASYLNNLGTLLLDVGDYEEAAGIFGESLELQRKVHGEEHPHTVGTLVNLADAMYRQGRLEQSRALHEQALPLREKLFGPESPEVTASLRKLAEVLIDLGDAERAVQLAARAEAVRLDRLGSEHFDVPGAMLTHARALRARGDLPLAEAKLREAVRGLERILGRDHPDWSEASLELASLRAESGDAEEAWKLALEVERRSCDHARLTAAGLSERHALRYADTRQAALDLMLDLLPRRKPSDIAVAWDHVVRSRALVLDEVVARRAHGPKDAEGVRAEAVYARASRDLANLLVSGSRSESSASPARIAEARRARDRAERALARRSRAQRSMSAGSTAGFEQVARRLPAASVLVGYIVVRKPSLATRQASRSFDRRYHAFVLRAGERKPTFHDLGDAVPLEKAVDRWRAAVADAGDVGTYRAAASELRRIVWDPLRDRVRGVDLAFIVADGVLHRVSFATLPDENAGYLVESGPLFCYLAAERDLAQEGTRRKRGAGMLAIGGVDFGSPQSAASPGAAAFAPLPSTSSEAEAVARIWESTTKSDVLVLGGSKATEAGFKAAVPGRRIVHLATHGFFDARAGRAAPGARSIGGLSPQKSAGSLVRSGLAFAGANRPEQLVAGEDGILTAEEIAALDLSSAEWVVLSACDTGLGSVQEGEGVLGLRRAFEVSGASTLVMSLWDVDDAATREWMELLYRAHFENRRSTAAAIREASRGVLSWASVHHKTTHPFFWGAFVAVGDWR